jgi:hypothetical protein
VQQEQREHEVREASDGRGREERGGGAGRVSKILCGHSIFRPNSN